MESYNTLDNEGRSWSTLADEVIREINADEVNEGNSEEGGSIVLGGIYRPIKRSLNEEDSEGFTTVIRKGKKISRRNSPPTSQISQEHNDISSPVNSYAEISISSKEVLPKQIGLARLLHKENITGILLVKYKNPFKVIIQFETEEDAVKILNCQNILDKGWTCNKTNENNYVYGIIRQIDLELDEKQIKDLIQCDKDILGVKRLNKKDIDGKWIQSDLVRICFQGAALPPYVYIYGLRIKVDKFVFPVTQCSKCWRFGHMRTFCPLKKQVCPKCSGDHDICDTVNFRCVNCKGNHMSMIKSKCPTYAKEKEIREYMSSNQCTYKASLKKINDDKNQSQDVHNNNLIPNQANISNSQKTYAEVLQMSCSEVKENSFSSEEISDNNSNTQIKGKSGHRNKKSKRKVKGKNERRKNTGNKAEKSGTDSNLTNKDAVNTDQDDKYTLRNFFQQIKYIVMSDTDLKTKIFLALEYFFSGIKYYIQNLFNFEVLWKILTNNG